MKIKQTTFGELRRGDRFALSQTRIEDDGPDNLKVDPAIVCEADGVPSANVPFNVVNLRDGRVRTFHDDEKVWVEARS